MNASDAAFLLFIKELLLTIVPLGHLFFDNLDYGPLEQIFWGARGKKSAKNLIGGSEIQVIRINRPYQLKKQYEYRLQIKFAVE